MLDVVRSKSRAAARLGYLIGVQWLTTAKEPLIYSWSAYRGRELRKC
jgi:hypothetical protein